MNRYLVILAHAVSLLLVVAAACMWVRSEFFANDVWYGRSKQSVIVSGGGDLVVGVLWRGRINGPFNRPSGYRRERPSETTGPEWTPSYLWLPRFSLVGRASRSGAVIAIPYWLVILFGLAMPAWGARQRWRRKADTPADHPLCPACGYDLYGTTSDHCPECGAERA